MIRRIFIDIIYYIIFVVSLLLTIFSIYKTRKSKYSNNIKLILYGLSLLIYVVIMSLNQLMSLIYDVYKFEKDGDNDSITFKQLFNNLLNIFGDLNKDIPFIISVFVVGFISFTLLLIGLILFIIQTL
tara:strand:+ start:270 stop:653 length:384 start_codon:yes stop_codon:yes gene_type:complete